jgi:hypothetical protein
MPETFQILLTILGNVAGYALAFLVVVFAIRSHGGSWVAGFPAAASALFILWFLTMSWYVGTMFYIDDHWSSMDSVPPWAESTSGAAENIQSEVIQVWLAALVFKYLRWPGSPESE